MKTMIRRGKSGSATGSEARDVASGGAVPWRKHNDDNISDENTP